ncbi:unnamed protein product [Miscanthus lutarioriparius]|uniref:non-specific serine/threonine protein kinase n=1 Tax=Miscanthus lutarioriparius TaxID=422564 RepID=A0A811PXB4_9POAL|nr:unnamed protein product [Miscanthus lutarioriparius]
MRPRSPTSWRALEFARDRDPAAAVSVSPAARDLVAALLVKDPRVASAIKRYPFFGGVNWALLRCTKPRYVPPSFSVRNGKAGGGGSVSGTGDADANDDEDEEDLSDGSRPFTGELFPVSPMPTIIRELTKTRPCTSSGSSSSNGDGGLGIKEIAAIASASAIVVVLLVALTLCICTRKYPLRPSKRSLGRRKVRVFADVEIGAPLTYETVVRATGNFNASKLIGNDGFGATYRAEVAPGVLLAKEACYWEAAWRHSLGVPHQRVGDVYDIQLSARWQTEKIRIVIGVLLMVLSPIGGLRQMILKIKTYKFYQDYPG